MKKYKYLTISTTTDSIYKLISFCLLLTIGGPLANTPVQANPRLVNRIDNLASAGRAWQRAPAAAARLESASARHLSRNFNNASAAISWKTAMPRLTNASTHSARRVGSISVSTGSLTRRIAPRNVVAAPKPPPILNSNGWNQTQTKGLFQTAELKKQYAETLSPESRRLLGRAIQESEKNTAIAKTRADQLLAREVQENKSKFLNQANESAVAKKGLITPRTYFESKTKAEAETALKSKFGIVEKTSERHKKHATNYFDNRVKRSYQVHEEPGHQNGKAHIDIRRRGKRYDDRERKFPFKNN